MVVDSFKIFLKLILEISGDTMVNKGDESLLAVNSLSLSALLQEIVITENKLNNKMVFNENMICLFVQNYHKKVNKKRGLVNTTDLIFSTQN